MTDYSALDDRTLQKHAVEGDRNAEEVLVERYLRLVRICARPLFLAGGDSEDLIQEGTFGLLSAIKNFDPEDGSSFRTFAEHCIRMRLLSAIKSASRNKHFPYTTVYLLNNSPKNPAQTYRLYPKTSAAIQKNWSWPERARKSFTRRFPAACPGLRLRSLISI